MSDIVAVRKPKAKRTKTEKLWQRGSQKKKENEALKKSLDRLVQRVQREVLPHEKTLAESQVPLCIRLLTLGQRKSLSNWQRDTLHDWIIDLFQEFQAFGLVDDELLNHMARYDAFRLGVELEDDLAPYEALGNKMRQFEEEAVQQQEEELQQHREEEQREREALLATGEERIERELDRKLGKRPEKADSGTGDLWEDDLDEEITQAQEEYDRQRAKLKHALLSELNEDIDLIFGELDEDDFDIDDEEFERMFRESLGNDFFGAGAEAGSVPKTDNANPLNNDTLQRLFRAAAAKLHPDRESDPELREKKQRLMATLLKARKQGDIITVMELHNTWVGEQVLSKADEKSLQAALENWIVTLESEKHEIVSESPLHYHVYEEYYDRSGRKAGKAIRQRIDALNQGADANLKLGSAITSLKALKPWLEDRYERERWSLGY